MEIQSEFSSLYCTDSLYGDRCEDAEKEQLQPGSCCMCNNNSAENDVCFHALFEKFIDVDGNTTSCADILSSALGVNLTANNENAERLCQNCFEVLQEFAQIERQLNELRYIILSTYNRTATVNNSPVIKPVSAEQLHINDASLDEHAESILYDTNGDAADPANKATEFYFESIINVDDLIEKVENDEEIVNSANWLCSSKGSNSDSCIIAADPTPTIVNITNNVKTEQVEVDICDFAVLAAESIAVNEVDQLILKEEEMNYAGNHTQLSSEENPFPLYKHDNNVFQCFCCEDADVMDGILFATHVETVHSCNAYTCGSCGNGYFNVEHLNNHINLMHLTEIIDDAGEDNEVTDGNVFSCKQCESSFPTFRLLRIHRRQQHPSSKHYSCTFCARKFNSKNLLNEHLNSHTGERPHKCHVCPKAFASKYIMQTHLKIHTKRERPFRCDMCSKCFLTQQNLRQHVFMHFGSREYNCNECDKNFSTQHALNVHGMVHSGVKPFSCDECGKRFARRAEIQDHQRVHTGERPFNCDMCHMSFAQRSNLMTHKKSTHLNERQHVCSICQRAFKRRRLLDYHIKSAHTGERPHKCTVCDAAFVYPEHLKKHERIHSGIKPFKCEICHKAFSSRDNRNAHRFVHSSKKPYECSECGNGFMRKQQLIAHLMRTAHNSNTSITNKPEVNELLDNDNFAAQFIEIDEDTPTLIVENIVQTNDDVDDEQWLTEHTISEADMVI